jgi:hypothetical protein
LHAPSDGIDGYCTSLTSLWAQPRHVLPKVRQRRQPRVKLCQAFQEPLCSLCGALLHPLPTC